MPYTERNSPGEAIIINILAREFLIKTQCLHNRDNINCLERNFCQFSSCRMSRVLYALLHEAMLFFKKSVFIHDARIFLLYFIKKFYHFSFTFQRLKRMNLSFFLLHPFKVQKLYFEYISIVTMIEMGNCRFAL